MFKKESKEQIETWISSSDLDSLGSYLVSGSVHGKPGVPVAELGRVEKIIDGALNPEERFKFGKKLLKRTEYSARNIGIHLIQYGWPKHKVESLLLAAADDENWIVREYAAGAFARMLALDFEHFSTLYLKWVNSESVNVKRAIALAVKYDAREVVKAKWKTYYKLIDPLMGEEAEYIRKNLGPFAIGDSLLSRFPEQVLIACRKWIKSENANVRWNVAMIFTAAAARNYAAEGIVLLRALEKDIDPVVARAAKKASAHLQKKAK
jgi:hypothetical protein